MHSSDTIYIETQVLGSKGAATAFTWKGEVYAEGRTIAAALSSVVGKLGKDKEMVGKPWLEPTSGLRGTVQ